jgi:hypothetical protein
MAAEVHRPRRITHHVPRTPSIRIGRVVATARR